MTDTTPRAAADVTHAGGMRAERLFPAEGRRHLDPFVVFERFHIEPTQGFETHPHRGFEIVSYMLDGAMAHADSMGHESVAEAGDAMRITTGRGMEHSEMPGGDGPCSGLQLWINLPSEEKEVAPDYEEVAAADLPTTETDGATVTTVVGEGSPIDLHTPVEYRDARVGESWTWTVPAGWNGALFAISGAGQIGDDPIAAGEYALVEDGGEVPLTTADGLRVAAVAGEPHGEPIRQRGPFVE